MSKYCKGHDIIKTKCKFFPLEESDYCNVHAKNNKECAICLNTVKLYSCEKIIFHKNIGYELKCGHIFHYYCIEELLMRGRTQCPMCRTRIDDDPMYMSMKSLEISAKEQERYSAATLLDIQTSQRRTESNGRRLLDAILGLADPEASQPSETQESSPST